MHGSLHHLYFYYVWWWINGNNPWQFNCIQSRTTACGQPCNPLRPPLNEPNKWIHCESYRAFTLFSSHNVHPLSHCSCCCITRYKWEVSTCLLLSSCGKETLKLAVHHSYCNKMMKRMPRMLWKISGHLHSEISWFAQWTCYSIPGREWRQEVLEWNYFDVHSSC